MEHKIIFLDIDGVLNVIPQGFDEYGGIFHDHFVENLRWIINETGAKLVISSTWRLSGLKIMQEMWEKRDLPGEVIGITPTSINVDDENVNSYGSVDRGHEIQKWIDDHGVNSYCIIDDDPDMLPSQMKNFVRTSNNQHHPDCIDIGYGLTRKCSEEVVSILLGSDANMN